MTGDRLPQRPGHDERRPTARRSGGRRAAGRAGAALALAVALGAGAAASAAATPTLTRVGARQRALAVADVVARPDGTAYVQGAIEGLCCTRKIWVFSPAGALVRTYSLPSGFDIVAYGNAQLYAVQTIQGSSVIDGFDPTTGAQVSKVGALGDWGGDLGDTDDVAVGPDGTVYESGGNDTITDPSDPESVDMINPVLEFTPSGAFSSYLGQSLGLAYPQVTVTSVNAGGDLLATYDSNGTGYIGVYSPTGTLLDHFRNFPPGPQYIYMTFSPNGQSIYADAEIDHPRTATATTYVEQLSLQGAVLARFGAISAGNYLRTPDDYDALSVAANGVGWAARDSGQLYRFRVAP